LVQPFAAAVLPWAVAVVMWVVVLMSAAAGLPWVVVAVVAGMAAWLDRVAKAAAVAVEPVVLLWVGRVLQLRSGHPTSQWPPVSLSVE